MKATAIPRAGRIRGWGGLTRVQELESPKANETTAELPGKSRDHRERGSLMAAGIGQEPPTVGHIFLRRERKRNTLAFSILPPIFHRCLVVAKSSQKPAGNGS